MRLNLGVWLGAWGVRRWPVACSVGLLVALSGPAAATSCLLDAADAAQLSGRVGTLNKLSIGKVAVTPCQGRVVHADTRVLFSRGAGVTQISLVRQGRDLRDDIPQPLVDIAMPGGIVGALWTSLTSSRPMRPGSKRFDDAEALMFGGQVLAGQDLQVPLATFGWPADAPVQLQGAPGGPRTLVPVAGRLTLPVAQLRPGQYQLLQGERSVPLEVVDSSTFEGLPEQLREIEATSPDAVTRSLRLTVLFWESGLVLNAVDADARRFPR